MKCLIRRIQFGMLAGVCSLALAMAAGARQSDQISITLPAGKKIDLNAYKGKVVLVQFLFTTCQHCQNAAELYAKMQREFGSAGFQAIGVAFNDEVQGKPGLVEEFKSKLKLNFPVGTATRNDVLHYLGMSQMEMVRVPQIVILGRDGLVGLRSETKGSPELQEEAHLRTVLTGLLKKAK